MAEAQRITRCAPMVPDDPFSSCAMAMTASRSPSAAARRRFSPRSVLRRTYESIIVTTRLVPSAATSSARSSSRLVSITLSSGASSGSVHSCG